MRAVRPVRQRRRGPLRRSRQEWCEWDAWAAGHRQGTALDRLRGRCCPASARNRPRTARSWAGDRRLACRAGFRPSRRLRSQRPRRLRAKQSAPCRPAAVPSAASPRGEWDSGARPAPAPACVGLARSPGTSAPRVRRQPRKPALQSTFRRTAPPARRWERAQQPRRLQAPGRPLEAQRIPAPLPELLQQSWPLERELAQARAGPMAA